MHWEQVSMQLKAGVMKDHEGTYIESVAFAYQEHSILVELLADDSVAGGQHPHADSLKTMQRQGGGRGGCR